MCKMGHSVEMKPVPLLNWMIMAVSPASIMGMYVMFDARVASYC